MFRGQDMFRGQEMFRGQGGEPQRYTDLTLYEGHLYPSDDIAAATRLSDEAPLVVLGWK